MTTYVAIPTGAAASISIAMSAAVPQIATMRLALRAPRLTDFDAYAEVFTSDRARYMGGPFDEESAFADFCQGVAGWMLRGAGMWTLTTHDSHKPLGWIYLWVEQGDPEPELGWVLTAAAEGQGYATEAARAVLPHAVSLFGPGGFVSYIDAANTASARIALRLGAQRDLAAEARHVEHDLHIYRHTGAAA
jgi:RimJ/RimL family protein N-acetyltransferase